MKVRSKRYREREKATDRARDYKIDEAVDVLKNYGNSKFDETVEISFHLGLDVKQPDGMIRGTVNLPHGTGKSVKVLCFCKGEEVKQAQAAGADYVGGNELIEKIQGGWCDFDVVVAHPDMMRDVSKLGKVLGPKGLMPSPKAGTVTINVGKAVSELKRGKVEIRSDKTAGLHVACGKVSFSRDALVENIQSVVRAVLDLKPASAKGSYLRSVSMCTTQGPGLPLQMASLVKS